MKRSKFSLSHFRLMSCSMGQLVPLTWFEVLPGDTIQQSTSIMLRATALVSPPMHPVHVRIHHFFVPNRIIWQGSGAIGSQATGGFENYITGGPTGTDTTVHPYITVTGAFSLNTTADYLGLPTAYGGTPYNVSALPFRAYDFIWNEYYRDEDLDTPVTVSTADGLDTTTSLNILNVRWQKDYYTTARTQASKGNTVSMFVPGAFAPIRMNTGATATTHPSYPGVPAQSANTSSTPPTQTYDSTTDTAVANSFWFADLAGAQANPGATASTVDIGALRHQFAIQRFQEARSRYGSRYVEYLRYLGIRSADSRLQRPEYLGGGTSTIQFSEVLQTAPTTSGTASGIGNMFGHGITAQRTNRYRRFFSEHGIVMTMMSVRPITVYTQPVRRAWLRGMQPLSGATAPNGLAGSREDYFVRELQGIGQQIVNQLEVDAGNTASPATAFGFQDRYDEYRRMESQVTGQFRSGSQYQTWHFARAFASNPALNTTFVACVPTLQPFADQSHDNLLVMANHSVQARRMVGRGGESIVR